MKVDPEPGALASGRWRVDTTAGRRATLQQVVQTQWEVGRARRQLAGAWHDASAAQAPVDWTPREAATTAASLALGMRQADYPQVAQLAHALRGLHGARLRQALSAR